MRILCCTEQALHCSDPAFLALGGCGVSVHEIPAAVLAGLRQQMLPRNNSGYTPTVTRAGLQTEHVWNRNASAEGGRVVAGVPLFADPKLPTAGLTLELWLQPSKLRSGAPLLDCHTGPAGSVAGVKLQPGPNRSVVFVLRQPENLSNSGSGSSSASVSQSSSISVRSDDLSLGAVNRVATHLALVLDGGPPLIRWVVNGLAQDGGATREFGWEFYNPQHLAKRNSDTNTTTTNNNNNDHSGDDDDSTVSLRKMQCEIGVGVSVFRQYGRQLTTSEIIENYRAGEVI